MKPVFHHLVATVCIAAAIAVYLFTDEVHFRSGDGYAAVCPNMHAASAIVGLAFIAGCSIVASALCSRKPDFVEFNTQERR